jgi:4-amino-4-deoxy-L-arabinose transferase-like glycosyltransferase
MDESLKQELDSERGGDGPSVHAPSRGVSAVRQIVVARRSEALCACLLLLMGANFLAALSRKSITNDEIVHIPAGYYHLVAGEFQLNNEHPPLVKMWAALPLLFIQPVEPPPLKNAEENFMERTWGFHARFWQSNRASFQSISFWTRAMMIPLALALGVLIFLYARRLFGDAAALFGVALYTIEPTFLAHGRVVHTDVPAALVYLLFFYTLQAYSDAPDTRRALRLGLVGGLALVTKFSMVVLVPVLVVYFVFRFWKALQSGGEGGVKRTAVHAALVALVALLVVNAAYYFERPPLEASDVRWVELKSAPLAGAITNGIAALSNVVPTYYLFGVYNVAVHNHYGHAASLLGMHNDLGWWYYFPVAFALKTTLPFLLLSVASLAWASYRLVFKRDARLLFLVVPFCVYTALSITGHINIGVRHFLPAYPFLFIMGGALLARLLRVRRMLAGPAVAALLVGWMGVEAARAFPDYTPYMNQLTAGRPGWRYLSDSNVEWGDDVGELAAYLKARGQTRVRAALAAGWSTLGNYGVEYVDMISPTGPRQKTRYVAIGASFLNGSTVPGDENVPGRRTGERPDFFARYRERAPEAVFGNSIYLYREGE